MRPSAVFVFPYGPVVWPPGFGTAGHGKAPPGKNCAAAGESLSSLGDCAWQCACAYGFDTGWTLGSWPGGVTTST